MATASKAHGSASFLELARVASFKDSRFRAPADRAFACRLARHGFFADAEGRLRCTHCNSEVPVSSAVSEDPLERHRRLSPDCPLFVGAVKAERPESPRSILERYKMTVGHRRDKNGRRDVDEDGDLTTDDGDEDCTKERLLEILQKSAERAGQIPAMEAPVARPAIVVDRLDPNYELLRAEVVRLSTFHDWPESVPVKKEDMAKAGLFYTGQADRVQCAFCRNYLKNWAPGDEPMSEHRKHFRECRFVKGLDTGTVEVDGVGANRQRIVEGLNMREHDLNAIVNPKSKVKRVIRSDLPVHSEFAEESKRVESFAGKPRPEGQNINVLANAGYYYTGPGDKVQCYYCSGSLSHWSAMDEPWVEHAKFFPRCGFLRSKRDPGYIDVIQKNFKAEQEQIANSSSIENNEAVLAERRVTEAMRSPTVTTVMEMGYSAENIKQVIRQRFAATGSDFHDVESLVEALSNQQPSAGASGVTSQSNYEPSAALVDGSLSLDQKTATGLETDDPLGARSILAENKRLWAIKTCKVCLDEEVNVVFLPCGHLACCNSCAPSLRNCAICRAVIRGTVRVFLY